MSLDMTGIRYEYTDTKSTYDAWIATEKTIYNKEKTL